ncbi:MAG: hypothetical protein ACXAD7_04665 [Candidatus Kariarchaeaceae archaeon]|jgi:hypothetical protein
MSKLDDRILELIAKKIETDENYRNRIFNALIAANPSVKDTSSFKKLAKKGKAKSIGEEVADDDLFADLPPLEDLEE